MALPKGKVQTVLGAVVPSSLGRTLTHEHLSLKPKFEESQYVPNKDKIRDCPYVLENYGWISHNPYLHRANVNLHDPPTRQAILEEVEQFKKNGGGTIVENSTYGIQRDIEFLKQLSVQTGVHIVAGTGYYVADLQDKTTQSIEEMMLQMKKDLLDGVSDTGIKCGVIGEVGCTWPLHAFERKSLQATGQLQSELKCPVIIHPGRNEGAPEEIVRIVQEAGGDISKTVMSHLERTIFDPAAICDLALSGIYCEFDLFGVECSYYSLNEDIDMPSDAQRIALIKHLVQEGFGDKILVSHDIHTKHRLSKYGGHGYSHILVNAVPKMLKRGLKQEDVDKILLDNPQRWLSC